MRGTSMDGKAVLKLSLKKSECKGLDLCGSEYCPLFDCIQYSNVPTADIKTQNFLDM